MADTNTQTPSDGMEVVPPTSAAPPAAQKKVDLDLDDAPFLLQENEAPPAPPPVKKAESAPPAVEQKTEEAPQAKKSRKKLFIILGAVFGALLLIGAFAVWWFLLRVPAAPPPPPVEVAGPEPEVIVVPTQQAPEAAPENMNALEPFWVENIDVNGKSHFMICSFSIVTDDMNATLEVGQKRLLIRDAIFFYLKSKTFEMLLDGDQTLTMKKDLVDIVNNYLSRGKVKDVLFERYIRR